jgi:hypothetical protein
VEGEMNVADTGHSNGADWLAAELGDASGRTARAADRATESGRDR